MTFATVGDLCCLACGVEVLCPKKDFAGNSVFKSGCFDRAAAEIVLRM